MRLIEPPAPLINDLKLRYGEPRRAYHAWSHIEALLALFEQHQGMMRDPTRVLWAIYYHDAIYDPLAKDNEERSAALFRQVAPANLGEGKIAQVEKLILATIKHELPEGLGFDVQADCAVFLDLDLSILAATDEAFDAYEEGVRREYAHVPEPVYRAARKQILERFVARPSLYFTRLLARQWDARARANLQRSIAKLGAPISAAPPASAPQDVPLAAPASAPSGDGGGI